MLVRRGKGGRRREVGIDAWGWENLRPWLTERLELPAGPLFCMINGPTQGQPWSAAAVRTEFRRHAAQAGVRRRFAPHQGATGPTGPDLPCMSYTSSGIDSQPTIQFSGCNVQIVNGMGKTASTNGAGNLVLGYDEAARTQSGSHNLILGEDQEYTSYGAIVAGYGNTATGVWASIPGGYLNTASGEFATVSGGQGNAASGAVAWSAAAAATKPKASERRSAAARTTRRVASLRRSAAVSRTPPAGSWRG